MLGVIDWFFKININAICGPWCGNWVGRQKADVINVTQTARTSSVMNRIALVKMCHGLCQPKDS